MKRLLSLLAMCVFLSSFSGIWAEDGLKIEPSVHQWGLELDLGWSPFSILPGRETTLWAGLEGDYKSWHYYHDPLTADALSSAKASDAAVQEAIGLWFLGISQGLVPQPSALGPGSRAWEDKSLLEAFAYYRGVYYDVLSSGAYLSDSDLPDKDGLVEASFIGGLAVDRLTKADAHNLKQGYVLEASATWAPRSLQSVGADFRRATAIVQGFLPLWDLRPEASRNVLSLMGAFNAAAVRMWGDDIPFEERQLIGGRAWGGIGGWSDGVGGAIRGTEGGRFDGTEKAVANVELRMNLPGFALRNPFGEAIVGRELELVPGLVAYADGGIWGGLQGKDPGKALSVGLGAFVTVMKYGTLAIYNDYWLSGGSPYEDRSFLWHLELGMHF